MNKDIKKLKEAVLVMYLAQLTFMIVGIISLFYWWNNSDKIVLIVGILSIYLSMNFYGLKIHLGRQITNDFETQAKKSLKLWTGLNRRNRRKAEKGIKKELLKKK